MQIPIWTHERADQDSKRLRRTAARGSPAGVRRRTRVMRLLLDTHLLLWVMQGSRALSAKASEIIRAADAVYVSAATMWKISIKVGLGKLAVDGVRLHRGIEDAGFLELPIGWRHTQKLRELPSLHRDPFDRMLVAQAMVEPLRLLTHDAGLAAYSELVTIV